MCRSIEAVCDLQFSTLGNSYERIMNVGLVFFFDNAEIPGNHSPFMQLGERGKTFRVLEDILPGIPSEIQS